MPSRWGFLLGGHLGWEIPAGSIPLADKAHDLGDVSGGGISYGLDGGFRFARYLYLGFTLEHASLGAGKNPSDPFGPSVASVSSDTSLLGVMLGILTNPDWPSVYFEVGIANRWYGFTSTDTNGNTTSNGYSAGEGLIGMGAWIPAGGFLRLLPKATVGFGSFSPPGSTDASSAVAHAFVMLTFAGFYNLDM